jgi:mono/diheme cytochrome c family protein
MRSEAIVMKPAAFDAWLRQQEKGAAPAPPSTSTSTSTTSTTTSPSASGLSVFNANSCSSCHTLTAAQATGKIGPDLDKLVAYAQQAHQPLASFVHESIVNPDAYIQPGFPKGLMPTTFGQTLSKTDIDALVTFLVQSSKQASKKG